MAYHMEYTQGTDTPPHVLAPGVLHTIPHWKHAMGSQGEYHGISHGIPHGTNVGYCSVDYCSSHIVYLMDRYSVDYPLGILWNTP